jgi:hypothetical protein
VSLALMVVIEWRLHHCHVSPVTVLTVSGMVDPGYSRRMEWWVVVGIATLAIALVVRDNWRAYQHWWPMAGRIRAERAADEAKRRRLHRLTHHQATEDAVEPNASSDTPGTVGRS